MPFLIANKAVKTVVQNCTDNVKQKKYLKKIPEIGRWNGIV